MGSNITNQTPFLRSSRSYPSDSESLSKEVDRTYIDIANAINQRTIGIYPSQNPSITGNSFFLSGLKQQSLRQIYTFGAVASGGSTSITIRSYSAPYIDVYGCCQTATDSRPLPFASTTANANIQVIVDSATTAIIINVGAASPAVVSGYIVLEWISNP